MGKRTRKNIRLQGWDYSNSAWYFVTICCNDRKKVFGEITDAKGTVINRLTNLHGIHLAECQMSLSQNGLKVREIIQGINEDDGNVHIDDMIIMPNHIHLIIAIKKESEHSPSLPNAIHYLKSKVTRELRKTNPGIVVWQKNYYEHIIRDDADYQRIKEYMMLNPTKWVYDKYFM